MAAVNVWSSAKAPVQWVNDGLLVSTISARSPRLAATMKNGFGKWTPLTFRNTPKKLERHPRSTRWLVLGLLIAALGWSAPLAAQGSFSEAEALRDEYRQLFGEPQRSSPGGPLHLQSQERDGFVQGHIHAVLEQPFAVARAALSEPPAWCALLLLASNVKACESRVTETAARLDLKVAATVRQTADEASLLGFQWRITVSDPDYLRIEMRAEEGPAGTRNYRLYAQLVELDRTRSLLRLSYEFAYSRTGGVAIRLYLATVARAKVGFTMEDGQPIRGLRGLVERNTMRYYIALSTYVEAQAASQPLEKALRNWYASAEKYPSQLHELTREEYLTMKRIEFAIHRSQKSTP